MCCWARKLLERAHLLQDATNELPRRPPLPYGRRPCVCRSLLQSHRRHQSGRAATLCVMNRSTLDRLPAARTARPALPSRYNITPGPYATCSRPDYSHNSFMAHKLYLLSLGVLVRANVECCAEVRCSVVPATIVLLTGDC